LITLTFEIGAIFFFSFRGSNFGSSIYYTLFLVKLTEQLIPILIGDVGS